MTSSAREISTFFCLALLLFCANEVYSVEGLCGKASGTWRGPCLSSGICNGQCKEREDAVGGGCYVYACYCHYDCRNP